MKLHANALLGPKGRATMVRYVLEEGIALTAAPGLEGHEVTPATKLTVFSDDLNPVPEPG